MTIDRDALRAKVAGIIRDAAAYDENVNVDAFADDILAIPEIADALRLVPIQPMSSWVPAANRRR